MTTKNNVLKIVACLMFASAMNIFGSQEPQNFTAKTIMQQKPSLAGRTIIFEGDKYKVTEDELNAYHKDNETLRSRWITLKKGLGSIDEINLSSDGVLIPVWLEAGSVHMRRKPPYVSTLVKVGVGALALVGLGAVIYAKGKSTTSNPKKE